MYRTILVPLDGSEFGEHSLPLALSIAELSGASLRLVHVRASATRESVVGDFNSGEQASAGRAYLEKVKDRIGKVKSIRCITAVVDGRTPDALFEESRSEGVDLVVMTTHGRGPLSRFWLGSVADELIRRLSQPILLVRPNETQTDLNHLPSLRRLLIPLDGSPMAEQIIEPAIELGGLFKSEFTLLHVIEPVILPDRRLGGNALSDPVISHELYSEADNYLEHIAERMRSTGVHVTKRVIMNRFTAGAVISEAGGVKELNLIAMTTHGRGGISRLMLGSVADKVVRGALTPVLLRHSTATHQ